MMVTVRKRNLQNEKPIAKRSRGAPYRRGTRLDGDRMDPNPERGGVERIQTPITPADPAFENWRRCGLPAENPKEPPPY